jgi:AcrR family transcriptional regulator
MVRSDARENRDRILLVARRALDESGDASLNQIAQEAGVGPGTLYRHFPNREALVLAVYRQEIEALVEATPSLVGDMTPIDSLRKWTLELVRNMRMKHGLGDALSPSVAQAVTEEAYGPVLQAITIILAAGKADGSIRDDADPADFLFLTGALWRAGDVNDDRPLRMLNLILDGLRRQ